MLYCMTVRLPLCPMISWCSKTSAAPQPGGSALCAMISVTILHIFHVAHRTKAIRWMDERVKVMNEIIAGMRVIKMYTWEDSFSKWIRQIRRLNK